MFNRVGTGLGEIKTAVNISCFHFAELPRAVPLQYFQGVQIQSGIDALERRERMEWWPKGGRKRKRKLKLRLRQHHSKQREEEGEQAGQGQGEGREVRSGELRAGDAGRGRIAGLI